LARIYLLPLIFYLKGLITTKRIYHLRKYEAIRFERRGVSYKLQRLKVSPLLGKPNLWFKAIITKRLWDAALQRK